MDRLEKVDEVAFVRFASVYRRFKDVKPDALFTFVPAGEQATAQGNRNRTAVPPAQRGGTQAPQGGNDRHGGTRPETGQGTGRPRTAPTAGGSRGTAAARP